MEDVWEEENVWEEDVWEEDVSEMGRRRRRAGGVKTRRRRGTCEEERSGKGLSDFPKILLSTSDFKRINHFGGVRAWVLLHHARHRTIHFVAGNL